MKTICFILLATLLGCRSSKQHQIGSDYDGIIFYSENSPFLVFYATPKNSLNKNAIVKLLDTQYGNRVWLIDSKSRFSLEDMLPKFENFQFFYLERPSTSKYAFVSVSFNRPIESKLPGSVNRSKSYRYTDIYFDQFFIDDRSIKIESLVFRDKFLDAEYKKLLEKHKGSKKISDPPLP